MRLTGRHEDQLAALQAMGLAGNHDLHFAFQHLHQRVERRGVFAQALPSSKAKTVTVPVGFFTISRLTMAPS